MSLKDFYQTFKGAFPLGVLKIAQGYVKNGHEPTTSLETAAIIYAAKFTEKPMKYVGYAVTDAIDVLYVHRLQAETPFGIRCFPLNNESKTRSLAVSKMGENLLYEQYCLFEKKPNTTFGIYEHFNHYAAVVEVEHDEQLADSQQIKKLANLLAKNALAWWPEYLKEQEKKKYAEKKKIPQTDLPNWHDFFLKQFIRFIPGVNEALERPSSFYSATITISDYLQNWEEQTGFKVKLTDINLFGFE